MKKANKKTVAGVLRRMAEMSEKDEEYAVLFAENVNAMLDDMVADDAFGTEGQLDPRGDHRE